MDPRKPNDPTPSENPVPSKIEIADLPLENGAENGVESDADRVSGGINIPLQGVMVSSNRPNRP